ncbi:type II toxin-antitoxin system RelE/ParE family toxin [Methylomonas sp. SURF-2]|uniref:Type II toxin-antitoxin system RelE/ParE family toxin n=1 Tax=Methylomonas subterranea TaxID=2952225 RepID=A0ABT1TGU8_9GAMM|nr:type II toxin-antitoxin system RelE/ParE family toxin [Methylomonas sp. SURF-2]MCQ8104678.1 type II toxin-antitoxin system RelE/ParE family toxin [Methylomonas sp. SURF-2]
MRIEILRSARDDSAAGRRFYEAQGMGDYFLDSMFSDIKSLLINAGVHPIHFGKYHRPLSRRFPFTVYYRVDSRIIRIYAVADCRRSPNGTKKFYP